MSDEKEIRGLFKNWIKSTIEGNLELARQCIADDAVFFVPGIGEMDKETFAQGAAGGSPEDSPIDYDLDSKLRELKVSGDQAYLWIESTLLCSPKNGDPATKMAGHSLSVLEKRDGRWQIIRDANTMTVVSE
ncbi:MAG: nuclear transport factor 2 family protein [Acidiferrobacterales bacterium]|nr:nuclear transport factor 2 family protein [Acidiferrobacterales bacterium]